MRARKNEMSVSTHLNRWFPKLNFLRMRMAMLETNPDDIQSPALVKVWSKFLAVKIILMGRGTRL